MFKRLFGVLWRAYYRFEQWRWGECAETFIYKRIPFYLLSALWLVYYFSCNVTRRLQTIAAVFNGKDIGGIVCVCVFFILCIVWLVSLFNLYRAKFMRLAVQQTDGEIIANTGRCETVEGPMGVGKTLFLSRLAYVLSPVRWAELQYDYYTMSARYQNPDAFETLADYLEFVQQYIAVCETYNFWAGSAAPPCIMANYVLKICGQRCAELTVEHITGRRKVGEKTVMIASEFADMLSNRLSEDRSEEAKELKKDIAEFFGRIRHVCDGYFIGDDQSADGGYIEIRRCTDHTYRLEYMEKVCLPRLLIWFFDRKKRRILRHGYCTEREEKFLRSFARVINLIGFFRIHYVQYGNRERSTETIGRGVFTIPFNKGFEYETRCMRFLSKSRNQNFEPHIYGRDFVHPTGERDFYGGGDSGAEYSPDETAEDWRKRVCPVEEQEELSAPQSLGELDYLGVSIDALTTPHTVSERPKPDARLPFYEVKA